MTMPPPEWQKRILARFREFPDESLAEKAAALGVSSFWLQMVLGTDAFREVLAREGLDGEKAGPEVELRSTDHLFQHPGPPASETIQEVDRSAFGKPEPKPLFEGQKKLQWSHDAIIDYMIENPGCSKTQIARQFGFSNPWVTRMCASTAFHEALAKRKVEIVDPALRATVEETMHSLVFAAADVIHERIAANDARTALRTLDIAAKMLGGGMRQPQVAVHNYVAVVPPKAQTAEEWSRQYKSPVLEQK